MDNLTNIDFLTDNNVSDRNSQISGKNIAWIGNDGNDDEIFFYNDENGSVIQLTDNQTYDSNPQVDGNSVVWSGSDGNDREIYLYNGSETIQLTDNDVDDDNPQNRIPVLACNAKPWRSPHRFPQSQLTQHQLSNVSHPVIKQLQLQWRSPNLPIHVLLV